MAKLPPVSARPGSARDFGPSPASTWPAHKDAGIPHPFDGPYAIMKGMQVELGSLQAKLEAEQEQRAAEVQSLRDEVRGLREALAKERAERVSVCTGLGDKLASEISRHDTSLTTLHDHTSAALRERTLVDDFESLNMKVRELTDGLQRDINTLNMELSRLDKRIEANTEGDNEFARSIVQELENTKKMLEENTSCDKVFAGWVEPRILLAGKILKAGCSEASLPPKVRISDRAKAGLQAGATHISQ